MEGGTVVGMMIMTGITEQGSLDSVESYILYISPLTAFVSSINVTLPAGVVLDSEGYRNVRSNSLNISLILAVPQATILTSPYTNHNPFTLIIQFDSPISMTPLRQKITCVNCECIDITVSRENSLRFIIHVKKEGEGIVGIPSGVSTSASGVVNDPIEYHFTYGKRVE